MGAVILTGGTNQSRITRILESFPEDAFSKLEIAPIKNSILISQIHSLISSLSITSSRPRAVVIQEAHRLTVPAQNALLKILEEPPSATEFVLVTHNAGALLPTIRSRCTVSVLSRESIAITDFPALNLVKQSLSLTPGDRIMISDSLGRKREEVSVWLRQCIEEVSFKLEGEIRPGSIKILGTIAGLLHQAYLDLQANVSVTLVMQNLFLSLPRLSQ